MHYGTCLKLDSSMVLPSTRLNLTNGVFTSRKSSKFESIASFTTFGYWGNSFWKQQSLCLLQLLATIVNPDPQSKMAIITMHKAERSHLLRPIKTSLETATRKTSTCPPPSALALWGVTGHARHCRGSGSSVVHQQLGGEDGNGKCVRMEIIS